jgi:hypothetical protein
MTEIPKVPNGKNWLAKGLLQAVIILALAAYGAVMTVTKNSGDAVALEKRLTTLETCMKSLEQVPTDVAGIKVSIGAIKESIDKLERTVNPRSR